MMTQIELTVDGMKCGGCSSRLKRVLEESSGIKKADIVLETKKVNVFYDAANVNRAAIEDLIRGAGFTVLAA
jgi:copper chaperone